MTRPLPPYARQYLNELPNAGLWVAIGPHSWGAASRKPFPIVVLPPESKPEDYTWPATIAPALILETGPESDSLLERVATALMIVGAPSVVAIREARLRDVDACVYFEAVADDAA